MRMLVGVVAVVASVGLVAGTNWFAPATTAVPASFLASAVPGPVVAIGGGGDQPSIVKRFIELAGGADAPILVLPVSTASDHPGEAMAAYFRTNGAHNVAVWAAATPAAADTAESLAAIEHAHGLYFGGGDQSRGMKVLKGTKALAAIRARHAAGAVVGGSSAGGAILSATMMTGGSGDGPLLVGKTQSEEGLGVIADYIVDQHFFARGRLPRLINALLDHPGLKGIGVDERTAAIFFADHLEIIGLGQAMMLSPPEGAASRRVETRPLWTADQIRLRLLAPGQSAPR